MQETLNLANISTFLLPCPKQAFSFTPFSQKISYDLRKRKEEKKQTQKQKKNAALQEGDNTRKWTHSGYDLIADTEL